MSYTRTVTNNGHTSYWNITKTNRHPGSWAGVWIVYSAGAGFCEPLRVSNKVQLSPIHKGCGNIGILPSKALWHALDQNPLVTRIDDGYDAWERVYPE